MHKQGQYAPVPLPPNPLTNTNPLTTGLQVGALGAAAGMGWAAIHRSIRMNAGNNTPVAVVKPLIVGALIGSALGTAAGMAGSGRIGPTREPTWEGVEEDIMNKASKYSGLNTIVEKRAMTKYGLGPIGTAADIGTYFIPGVGQARMGWDAVRSFGGSLGSLFKGQFRQAGGKLLSGLGSTAMLGASLIPGGQLLTGAGKALRAGKAVAAAGKAAKPAFGLAERMGRVFGPRVGEGAISGMEQAGEGMKNLLTKGQRTAAGWGSVPLAVGGSLAEGSPTQQMSSVPGAMTQALASNRWGRRPIQMPEMEMPEIFRKRSQDYSSLMYNPAIGSRTLTDLYMAIRADAGLEPMDKGELVNQIKAMTGYANESTPLSALMIKGLGGTIGWLISKYFGMGPVGQVLSAIGGFGLGTVINNQLNKPPDQYPGYRTFGN